MKQKYQADRLYIKTSSNGPIVTEKEFKEKSVKDITDNMITLFEEKTDKTVYSFIGSSEIKDRDGDIVVQDGIDVKELERNPVFLWAHMTREAPIGKVVAVRKNLANKKTYFEVVFASTPDGEKYESLVKDGILRATSIGFMVKKWHYEEKGDDIDWYLDEISVHEISLCSVPANQDAVEVTEVKENEKSFTPEAEIKEVENKVRAKYVSPNSTIEITDKDIIITKSDATVITQPLSEESVQRLIEALTVLTPESSLDPTEEPQDPVVEPAEEADPVVETPIAGNEAILEALGRILDAVTPTTEPTVEEEAEVPTEAPVEDDSQDHSENSPEQEAEVVPIGIEDVEADEEFYIDLSPQEED